MFYSGTLYDATNGVIHILKETMHKGWRKQTIYGVLILARQKAFQVISMIYYDKYIYKQSFSLWVHRVLLL